MKILIIEDETSIANAIKKGLLQENFVVDVANDGEQGYDLASFEKYDVILLDLMLPGMSGTQICKALREEGNTTPILMLTAKDQTTDKVSGLTIGADDYLTKPFEFEELLARIRALARRPQAMESEKISYEDLELDLGNATATRQGKAIQLSRKEFSLLEYLARNKENVLSKDQIIENVWNFDSDILPNTVEVYIRYLRNKVDKPFKKDLIKTVRGFGYSLKSD